MTLHLFAPSVFERYKVNVYCKQTPRNYLNWDIFQ
jgi:hypothetical protein